MQLSLAKLNKWAASFVLLGIFIFSIVSCTPVNHSPVIISLEAKQNVIAPRDSCLIGCVASDEDGDELSYEWSASKGDINGDGATVAWSAPESKGIYNITVRVTDGNGGEATDSITITVRVNHPPAIISVIADADWAGPSSSCQVKCDAEDPDGDELSYEWSVKRGDIFGTGPVVIWTAPDRVGIYDITVVVSDGQGGEDTRSLTISVALNPPPVIEGLIVTPKEPKYLKEYSGGYRILRDRSCEIECVVKDASDELVYEWSADEGEISGESSVVTWTAPGERGEVTIMVIVSDAEGSKASKSIIFDVETCACAFR